MSDFFRRSLKKFCIFPQKFHLSAKISDDLVLVIDLFSCFNVVFFRTGAKSIADSDTEGPKSLLLGKFTMLSLLFLPPMGAMAGFAPLWIRHCLRETVPMKASRRIINYICEVKTCRPMRRFKAEGPIRYKFEVVDTYVVTRMRITVIIILNRSLNIHVDSVGHAGSVQFR